MKVKIGISIAFSCVLSLALCGQSALAAPAPASQPTVASGQDFANDLVVGAGKSVLVDCALPIERVAVGSGDIAEVTVVSPTELMLNGKTAGDTSLIVWQKGGSRQFFNVLVRANNSAANDRVDALRRELRTELPGQDLRVTSENGLVFLRGTVKDLVSNDRAVQIAATAGKVVNLLYVEVPAAEPQILLKVRFASLDRSLNNQLGINLFSLGAANTIGSVTTQQFSPPVISATGSSGSGGTTGTGATATISDLMNLYVFRPDINLGATIKALEAQGVVQVLAEPNVMTSNGKQGSILAGGQYPYPVVQGTSAGSAPTVTIQFKEFGVRLNFIPTITPRGTIRLQVAPEVSSLDFANGITISGFTVPGLDVRSVKTEVELAEGQSFAIGGLLDNRETKTLSKIPFIGDVPILGKFFQSITKTKTNTELIVIVTPEIVAPIPAGASLPQLKYPENFLPSASGISMTTPGADVTGAKPSSPTPQTMPVEKLIRSMQPEQPLVIDGSMSTTGFSTTSSATSTGTTQ
ncbi:MAG: pilus assembly protein N-terminal domain-containing protein [Acidobacteriaceae bacterium]|nr:pilus assembly protein N-terminal domain-containing protein [Acidobacteriaceae bacterium]